MAQGYRVKNTFAEHPASDDEAPTMPRSNSWSGSTSTSGLSMSSENQHVITASNLCHRRIAVDRCVLDEPRPSGIQHDAPLKLTHAPQGPMFEDGKDDISHIVFESDSHDSSVGRADSNASAEVVASSSLDALATKNALASQLHARMHCTPCLRFIVNEGCKDGQACKFCHFDHADEKLRQRPSKGFRAECKRAIQDVFDSHSDKDKRLDQLQIMVHPKNPFMRKLLCQRIANYEDPPVLHTAGQIDRPGSSQQLEHLGPNGARAPSDYETKMTLSEQAQAMRTKIDLFRHRGRTKFKDSVKNASQVARGGQASEGQLRKPVAAARGAGGLESSAPPLLEPSFVSNASPPGRSKVSL